MFYLILIVFLAELIILYQTVAFLINADRCVCEFTEHINKRRTLLKWRLQTINEITKGINEVIPIVVNKLNQTKKNLIVKYTKDISQFIILLFFKPKYKKLLIGTKTGIKVAKKLFKI